VVGVERIGGQAAGLASLQLGARRAELTTRHDRVGPGLVQAVADLPHQLRGVATGLVGRRRRQDRDVDRAAVGAADRVAHTALIELRQRGLRVLRDIQRRRAERLDGVADLRSRGRGGEYQQREGCEEAVAHAVGRSPPGGARNVRGQPAARRCR
jgi:hypothetical protein